MLPILHKLQSEEGLAIGGSAGINVAGAMRVAEALGPGHTVVTVCTALSSRMPPPPPLGCLADPLRLVLVGWSAFRARQVLCDRAERYAGKLYNAPFLQGKGLPAPPWLESPPVTLANGMLESCLIDAWPDEGQ